MSTFPRLSVETPLLTTQLSIIGLAVFVGRGAVQPRSCITNAHGSVEEASAASAATLENGR